MKKVFIKWALSILIIFFCKSAYAETGYLYIVNSTIKTVDLYNVATGLVEHTYTGFDSPVGVVVNPAGTKAYVTNSGISTYINVIDVNTHVVSQLSISPPHTFGSPQFMAVSPDGITGYVVDINNNVVIVTLSNGDWIATVTDPLFNAPVGIALNSAGTHAFVTNSGDNKLLDVLLSGPYTVTDVTLTVPGFLTNPQGIVIKGSTAYVVNGTSTYGAISIIDLSVSPSPIANTLSSGLTTSQMGAALSSNGNLIYVTNGRGGVYPLLPDPINAFPISATLNNSNGIAINGNTAYVVNSTANTVSVINLLTGLSEATISSANFNSPNSIALSIDKHYAYVTNNGDSTLAVIDLTSPSYTVTLFNITAGGALDSPTGIVISNASGTNSAYICNGGGTNTVTIIDITAITSGDLSAPFGALNTPLGIALSSEGNKAVVINGDTTSYDILDLVAETAAVFNFSASGVVPSPGAIVLSSDETQAYVAYDAKTLAVINLNTSSITNIFPSNYLSITNGMAVNSTKTGAYITSNDGTMAFVTFPPAQIGINVPSGVKISPDGTKAYVASGGNPNFTTSGNYGLSIIDLVTGGISTLKSLNFTQPSSVALNAAGTIAYVTNYDVGISKVDLATLTVSALPFTSGLGSIADITIDPSNGKAYVVCNTFDNNVYVVDFALETVTGLNMDLPGLITFPTSIALIGDTLYVGVTQPPATFLLYTIDNINLQPANANVQALPGNPPITFNNQILGICPADGSHIYVVDSTFPSTLYKIDIAFETYTSFNVGNLAQYIAIKPDGTKAYISYQVGIVTAYDLPGGAVSKNYGFNAPQGIYGRNILLNPTISGISPTNGPIGGGTAVRITGSNFTGTTSVNFGLNAATFSVDSPNVITAYSPTVGAAGTIHIQVTSPEGTSPNAGADQFTYTTNVVTTFSAYGNQRIINGLFEKDIINEIFWSNVSAAAFYSVYDENNNLLFRGTGGSFYDHNKKNRLIYRYFVTWTDGLGNQSTPVTVSLP